MPLYLGVFVATHCLLPVFISLLPFPQKPVGENELSSSSLLTAYPYSSIDTPPQSPLLADCFSCIGFVRAELASGVGQLCVCYVTLFQITFAGVPRHFVVVSFPLMFFSVNWFPVSTLTLVSVGSPMASGSEQPKSSWDHQDLDTRWFNLYTHINNGTFHSLNCKCAQKPPPDS